MTPTVKVKRCAIIGLAVLGVACDQTPAPTAVTRGTATHSQSIAPDAAYYYYYKDRIGLTADPTQIVVQSESASLLTDARTIATNLGSDIIDGGALPQAPNHRLLKLLPGTSFDVASRVRDAMRTSGKFLFVAHRYTTAEGGDFIPLNRLMLQFRAGVTTKQADSLVRSIGATVLRPPRPDSGFFYYVISYPRDSIEFWRVAAQLYTHPLMEWSNPDRISSAHTSSVADGPVLHISIQL